MSRAFGRPPRPRRSCPGEATPGRGGPPRAPPAPRRARQSHPRGPHPRPPRRPPRRQPARGGPRPSPRRVSAPLPLRAPLLEERPDALLEILAQVAAEQEVLRVLHREGREDAARRLLGRG